MKKFLVSLLLLFLFLSSAPSWAGTRDNLFYQGLLFDPNGTPIDGSLSVTFKIYTSPTGGSPLWEETQSVTMSEGIFTVALGSTTPFTTGMFDQETLYLGMQVAGDSELSPRSALYSVPFAEQCEEAITAKSLADNIVTSKSIVPGAIQSSHLAAGAVGSRELSTTGVTAGTYTLATITVDGNGRITLAANGSAGGGGVGTITGVTAGTGLSGGGTSGNVTLSIAPAGVTTNEIADGTITNADINAAAGIVDTKLATISTAGKVSDSALSSNVSLLGQTIESSEITDGTISAADLSATLTFIPGDFIDLASVTHNTTSPQGFRLPQIGAAPLNPSSGEGYLGWDQSGKSLKIYDGSSWVVVANSGDITGVIAGTGLTGGGTSGDVTLNVDVGTVAGKIVQLDGSAALPSVSGANLSNLNASNLSSGSVPDARLSANVSLLGSSIESSEITDGTITNSDINAAAGIADSKLATISTAGKVADAALSSNVSLLGQTIESAEITDGTITSADISGTAGITDAQVNNNLTISGGTVDNTPIGATVASTGVFTKLTIDGGAADGLVLNPFGTGAGQTSELRFGELAANGTNTVGFKAPDTIAADQIWTLPVADGTSNQVLSTNGSGILNWTSAATGTITGVTAGTGITGGGSSGNVTVNVDVGTTAGKIVQLDGTGKLPAVDGSALTGVAPSSNSVTSSSIVDGSITNADINGSAAIADSKLATISSAGKVADSALSSNVSLLGQTIESSEITDGTITNVDISNTAGITDAQVNNDLTVSGGTINNTPIGGTTPSSGIFTTLTVDGNTASGLSLQAFGVNPGQTAEIRLQELDANGANYIGFKAPDTIAADQIWTLPAVDGTSGQVLSTNGSGVLNWTSAASGTITGVTAGTGLTGGGTSGNVTVNVDVGTTAGKIVQLDGTGKLPAVDGSSLTGVAPSGNSVTSSSIVDGSITNVDINAAAGIVDTKLATISTAGKVSDSALSSNVSLLGQTIESSEITDGTITSADISGTAGITDAQVNNNLTISGGTINNTPIGATVASTGVFTKLTIDGGAADGLVLNPFGTGAGQTSELLFSELAVNGTNVVGFKAPDDISTDKIWTLPAVDGTSGQVLSTNGSGILNWTSAASGTITGVTAGTGITGGGTSGNVTVNVDVGTTAGKIVQLNGSAALPAVSGANLTSLSAANIAGTITDSQVSDTLTASVFKGSGTTTDAVDLGTAEVAGTLGLIKGGTGADLSATGGANQFVKQSTTGGALSVGSIADADVPNNITIDLATNATSLAANGTNCTAGQFPLGVDASGNAEGCTAAATGTVTSVGTGTGLTGGAITSSGTLSLDYSATLAGNPALSANQSEFASTGIIFEGATANTSEGLLTVADPSSDRTWTLPDVSGNIVTTGDSGTVTSTMIADATITTTDISGTAGITDAQVNNNLTISGGTVDNTPVGATTASTGAFTTLSASTSLTAPNGTAPTVDAAGKLAVDTTDDQLVYFGTAKRVLPYRQTKCATVESLAAADDNVPIFIFHKAATLVQTSCYAAQSDGTAFTTAPTYTLEHGSGSAVTGAATCGTTASYTNVTAGNTFTAGEVVRFDTTNTPSPSSSTWTTICIVYTEDAQ